MNSTRSLSESRYQSNNRKHKRVNTSTFSSLAGEYATAFRTQNCIECGYPMGDMPGSRDAICTNCGYKDPCCE